MLKIGILQLGYETNTFAAGTAGIEDMGAWMEAEKVIDFFRLGYSALSGAITAIERLGQACVPLDLITRGGAFNAGPILRSGTLQAAMDRICAQLKDTQLDGLYFAMHGATCQEDLNDGDSYCLARLRQVLGSKPIMCSMDLHGNITQEMIDLSDGIFGIKEHPHTDYYEAGYLAASTLIGTLLGKVTPRMALHKLPMLINSASGNTISGTGKKARDHLLGYVQEQGLIDATYFHGFSAMDSPITGVSVLAVTDGSDPEPHAMALAAHFWEQRDRFNIPVHTASDAIREALNCQNDGYVVINEGSDNPGSGCPGDGTHLLREMLTLSDAIMGPLFDPESAAICHTHTLGDRFQLSIGGKTDPIFGEPVRAEVELLSLSDGSFTCAGPIHQGMAMCYGPSARVRIGKCECILVSQRFQTYDDRPFLMTGAELKDYRIVALKSMNHFRAYFTDRAAAIITADTPTTYPADLNALPYRHIPRPIYPIDAL